MLQNVSLDYIQAYVDHDVRQLSQIAYLVSFRTLQGGPKRGAATLSCASID